jgi:predicted house-cleaning noncanonical NTP pyrophosphatase (MazG superfamily)
MTDENSEFEEGQVFNDNDIEIVEESDKSIERHRATDDEIERRRDRILELYGEYGESRFTHEDLARVLKVSVSTIERDIKEIRRNSFLWVDGLAREGYVWECRKAYATLDSLIRTYKKRLSQEGDSISIEDLARISNQVSKLEEIKMQIIQQPTLYALRLALRQNTNKMEDLLVEGD